MKEVDYYKKQERAAYTALQNLRMQYEEVIMNVFLGSTVFMPRNLGCSLSLYEIQVLHM